MSNPTGYIPGSDLALATPGAFDSVIGVDEVTKALRRFPLPSSGTPKAYASVADLPASADENTAAYVNNDPTTGNNGLYAYIGGSWVQSADRVTGIESRLDPLELNRFAFRGTVAPGTDITTITRQGMYYGGPSGGFVGLPADFPPEKAFTLFVHDLLSNAGRFQYLQLQTIDAGEISVWRKNLDHNNPTSTGRPWHKGFVNSLEITSEKLATGAVTQAKLGATYTYRGTLSSGSANDVTNTGRYLVTAQLDDMPVGSPVGGMLHVENHSNSSYVLQTFTDLYDASLQWSRTMRVPQGVYYPWKRVGATSLPLSDKTVAFFGDSITEGGDYPSRVASRTGCTALNFGFGGCRMAAHTGLDTSPLYDTMSMYNLARYINTGTFTELLDAADALFVETGDDNRTQAAALAAQDWNEVDYVVIYYGTNDYNNGVPLGTATDTTGATFHGAINYTVDQLLTAYPHLQIIFVAPMWRARRSQGDGLESDTNPNANGAFLIEFVDAVLERAAAHKLPALDLYRTSGINIYNHTTLLSDGLHPMPGVGYQRVADKVAAFLSAHV